MGHQGINKVVSRIQTRHDWVGLQEAASKWVNSCPICQQQKNPVGRLRFELQNIVSSEPNELIQFDHVNVCQSGQGNKKILVIIDHFTKYAEAVPCTKDDLSAERTVQILLDKWFARHGTPSIAQSDNGAQFTAEVTNQFLRASQLTQVHSTANHPATQGLVERQKKTLLTLLKVYCSRHMKDWDEHLDDVVDTFVLRVPRVCERTI